MTGDRKIVSVDVEVQQHTDGFGYQTVVIMIGTDGRNDEQRGQHHVFRDQAEKEAEKIRQAVRGVEARARSPRGKPKRRK